MHVYICFPRARRHLQPVGMETAHQYPRTVGRWHVGPVPRNSSGRMLFDSKLLVSGVKTPLSEHLPERVPALSDVLQTERQKPQRGRAERGLYFRYEHGECVW